MNDRLGVSHHTPADAASRLCVTLEFRGRVVALDESGEVVADCDERLVCSACPEKLNTHPHGLCIDKDGNVWFTEMHADKVGRLTRG